MKYSILITGASGFIGSFMVEEALAKNFEVWAGIRATSSREYLQDQRIHCIELDTAHPDTLHTQLAEHQEAHGRFDYVIHCAGATKCADSGMFDLVNFRQTVNLAEALRNLGMTPRQFVFISTLSVYGAIHEADYAPITEADEPQPDTAYGRSKRKAELYLQEMAGFPYVIIRPTGVYGPREKDYFMMAQSIRHGIDVSVGFKRQDLTFIYVKDLVQAVFRAIAQGVTRRAYNVSDGGVYSSSDFGRLIQRELGVRHVLRPTLPLWVLKAVSCMAGRLSAIRGRANTLNPDKYRIMKQRNWRCDITPARQELDYRPQYPLARGVQETIAWYLKNDWL